MEVDLDTRFSEEGPGTLSNPPEKNIYFSPLTPIVAVIFSAALAVLFVFLPTWSDDGTFFEATPKDPVSWIIVGSIAAFFAISFVWTWKRARDKHQRRLREIEATERQDPDDSDD